MSAPKPSSRQAEEEPVDGNTEADNGETLARPAIAGVGFTRVGNFSVADDLAAGRLLAVLEVFNPGAVEQIHVVSVCGPNMPARGRVFVDFLVSNLR